MQSSKLILLAAALGVFFSGSAAMAQEISTQRSLSLDVAMAIAHHALDKCRADGFRVTVTIVDGGGMI